MDHTAEGHQPAAKEEEAIQHPLGVYFKIWILLFVLSAMSYAVDYYQIQGYMRWFLILLFMILKAGLIVAVFMHMVWERLAMVYFILLPPLLLLTLVAIGSLEADWTFFTRAIYFLQELVQTGPASPPQKDPDRPMGTSVHFGEGGDPRTPPSSMSPPGLRAQGCNYEDRAIPTEQSTLLSSRHCQRHGARSSTHHSPKSVWPDVRTAWA